MGGRRINRAVTAFDNSFLFGDIRRKIRTVTAETVQSVTAQNMTFFPIRKKRTKFLFLSGKMIVKKIIGNLLIGKMFFSQSGNDFSRFPVCFFSPRFRTADIFFDKS